MWLKTVFQALEYQCLILLPRPTSCKCARYWIFNFCMLLKAIFLYHATIVMKQLKHLSCFYSQKI